MRRSRWTTTLATTAALAGVTTGCGGGKESAAIPQGVEGRVIFSDSLDDNHNGWLEVKQTPFRDGEYVWNGLPPDVVAESAPDALAGKRLPSGVEVRVGVEQREGAALRMVACRESGEQGTGDHAAYQLGVDGRQALIRLWHEAGSPPKVLARRPLALPNGKAVALEARCLEQSDGSLALTLRVDGKSVLQATEDKPLPNGGVTIAATARADTDTKPTLAWNEFVVRSLSNGS